MGEVQLHRDAHHGAAGAVDLVQEALHLGLDGGLAGAGQLHLLMQRLGGEAILDVTRVVAHALGEELAVVGHDGHVVGAQTGHRGGHQVDDALDLLLGEHAAGDELDHDRGRGGLLLLGEELLFGDVEQHRGVLDALDLADDARELAHDGAVVGGLLLEVGADEAVRLVAEELAEPNVAFLGVTGDGQLDAGLVGLVLGHRDGGAFFDQVEGDLLFLQHGGGLGGDLRLHVGVDHHLAGRRAAPFATAGGRAAATGDEVGADGEQQHDDEASEDGLRLWAEFCEEVHLGPPGSLDLRDR
ncbi:hypothetical protein D3C72_1015730 [compost metagenome]